MKKCPECEENIDSNDGVSCTTCRTDLGDKSEVDADDLVGLKLGERYELKELLGQGAMGWIYRGEHTELQSSVAVKVMKPRLRPDRLSIERFIREARASSRLNHPNVVATIDFGESQSGLLYLVTEYVRGEPLSRLLDRERALPPGRALAMIIQILSALDESHSRGVVHRDLKTDNVMVTRLSGGQEFVKVLDFGIAKILHEEGPGLTMDGEIFGTPDYMAPEQIRSKEITAGVDIYACGVVLFELLTALLPYRGDNIFDIMKDHLYAPIPKLVNCGVDREWAAALQPVLERAMAKKIGDRFQSASEMKRALGMIQSARFQGAQKAKVQNSAFGPIWKPERVPGITSKRGDREPLGNGFLKQAPEEGDEEDVLGERSLPERQKRELGTAETAHVLDSFVRVDGRDGHAAPDGPAKNVVTDLHLRSISAAEEVGRPGKTKAELDNYKGRNPTKRNLTEKLLNLPPVSLDWIPRREAQAAIEGMFTGSTMGLQLVGEAGSGKTALSEWAAGRAKEAGFEEVRIEAETAPIPGSWGAMRRAIEILLEIRVGIKGGLPTRAALEEAIKSRPGLEGESASLLELFGYRGPLVEAEEGVRKCESLSALARVLLREPTSSKFLIFEDAHKYDRLSQLSLLRLARLCRSCKHRVLITSEIPLFLRREGWIEMEMGTLDRSQIRFDRDQEVAAPGSGDAGVTRVPGDKRLPVISDKVRADHSWTPFKLVQTLAVMAEIGEAGLSEAGIGEADLTEATTATATATTVEKILKARLSLLPGSALKLLQALSVWGGSGSLHELRNLLPGEKLSEKDEYLLLRRGYLLPGRDNEKMRISHPLIRETVINEMDRQDRSELHERMLAGEDLPPHVAAYHAYEAGAYKQAMELYLKAAALADRATDGAGASRLYKKAEEIARWKLLLDEKEPVYVDMRVRFARALLTMQDFSAAEIMFKSVENQASDYPRLASWVGMGLADIFMLQGRPVKAVATLTAALGHILPSGEQDILAETYLELGNLLVVQGKPQRAQEELQEGMDIVTMGRGVTWEGAPESLWKILLRMADLGRRKAESEKGEERNTTLHKALLWGGGAVAQSVRLSSPLGRARAHEVVSKICATLGMDEQQARHSREAASALSEIGGRSRQKSCLLDIGRMGPGASEVYRRGAYRLGGEAHWCEEI